MPGVQNTIADEESCIMKDRTDWKLNPEVFNQIDRLLGPLVMDLFYGYANPPWNLVGRILLQVQAQRVTIILVAPVWKTQAWYPTLLGMLMDLPSDSIIKTG